MKNLFKRFTAILAAFLIFFTSFVSSSVSVSALSSDGLIYSSADSFTFDFMKSCYDDLLINPSLSDVDFSSSAVYIHFFGPSKVRVIIFPSYTTLKQSTSDGTFTYYFPYDSSFRFIPHYAIETSISTLSSSTFNLTTLLFNEQYSFFAINDDYTNLVNSGSTLCGFTAYNSTKTAFTGSVPSSYYTYKGSFISYVPHSVSPSEPDSSGKLTLTGVRLGVDKKGFLDWLITEGKDSVINSTGFSFTQTQLSLLVDVFDSYGNSLFPFYSSLVKTFKLTQHSLTGASALLSTLQELYRDYLDYKNSIEIVEITPDTNAKPHWRQDKTDNTLATDQEDDTSVVSILREILRTIIYLPSSIRTSFSDLATNIVSIMYNWNRLFDKLDYISPDISGDVDRLIDAINNISVDVPDTSVDVTITDEKQQELDDFFNGWSVDFDNKVKEKFPVTAQLGELFNDDFFEKCGIDCNGDGEVYSYYSENVYAVSEVSTVPELSASAPGSDQKLVSDFIGQFDSADVNFLNDANFSSSVPDWSITVGGKKCEVFSFKLYAKYRTQIHFIISFILWTVYLLSLYKSLPSIIGQVSDVVHGIEKM